MIWYCEIIFIFLLFDCILTQNDKILPKPDECGQIEYGSELDSTRIKSRLGEHPWVASIGYWYPRTKEFKIDCTGSLISHWHVITQGECINFDKSFQEDKTLNFVGLGDWNLNKPVDCVGGKCAPGALRILIEKTFTKYDHQSLWINNIGIIKLATHVPFSKWISPICLPNQNVHKNIKNYAGSSFVVAGWSSTITETRSNFKLTRQINVEANEICSNYREYISKYDSMNHFCINKSNAPCSGDGPIMGIDLSDPDKPYWYLFGLYTFGPDRCVGPPKICTQIFPQLEWINDVIHKNV